MILTYNLYIINIVSTTYVSKTTLHAHIKQQSYSNI